METYTHAEILAMTTGKKKQPRHQRGVMNKTEREWADELAIQGKGQPLFEAITLRIGHDCRYTPDFFWLNSFNQGFFDEVKGFRRDDAMVKIRAAATRFPMFTFRLVQKTKAGWKVKVIPSV